MMSQYCFFYLAAKIISTRADFYDWFQDAVKRVENDEISNKNKRVLRFGIEPLHVDNLKIVL